MMLEELFSGVTGTGVGLSVLTAFLGGRFMQGSAIFGRFPRNRDELVRCLFAVGPIRRWRLQLLGFLWFFTCLLSIVPYLMLMAAIRVEWGWLIARWMRDLSL
ncbi:hypothetical protein MYSTI_01092 [Myxococcus stipitatus DSM 14675]|uniref:Uncharacterized protein n=1 Tax=Myxococcus stipitatus (strain DSM 14675 / JCM 12634 / Mx s8) TaxID=1278073 RepID=L7U0Y1_MYXSD|nr:hypothetical protein [Myxococcus stipitatus]AGC42441.1 hypothetical protein MYSTI_01092 [Myxococcus stipitatus DSM 14675]